MNQQQLGLPSTGFNFRAPSGVPRGSRAVKPQPLDQATVRWDGAIDEIEAARPGGLLMGALVARAAQLQHPLQDLAGHLGVTYGYVAQLRGGHRTVQKLSEEFFAKAAEYLGVPRMLVLMLAGRVPYQDVLAYTRNVARLVDPALAFIAQDPEYAGELPPDAFKLPREAKFFLVRLYEDATGKNLLGDRRGTATSFAHDQAISLAARQELTELVAEARARKAAKGGAKDDDEDDSKDEAA